MRSSFILVLPLGVTMIESFRNFVRTSKTLMLFEEILGVFIRVNSALDVPKCLQRSETAKVDLQCKLLPSGNSEFRAGKRTSVINNCNQSVYKLYSYQENHFKKSSALLPYRISVFFLVRTSADHPELRCGFS